MTILNFEITKNYFINLNKKKILFLILRILKNIKKKTQ